jgi:hypothetical protein
MTGMLFLIENSLVKMVHGYDATANPLVIKFQSEVFAHSYAVTIKWHSSMLNWLFGLPG